MTQFKTQIADTSDGKASFGLAYVQDNSGQWHLLGQTNNYREYPRAVRARTAAEAICRAYARKHFPLCTFTATQE